MASAQRTSSMPASKAPSTRRSPSGHPSSSPATTASHNARVLPERLWNTTRIRGGLTASGDEAVGPDDLELVEHPLVLHQLAEEGVLLHLLAEPADGPGGAVLHQAEELERGAVGVRAFEQRHVGLEPEPAGGGIEDEERAPGIGPQAPGAGP